MSVLKTLDFKRDDQSHSLPTVSSPGTKSYTFNNCSVQSLSCVRLFVTPWIAACQASLSITNSRSLLKLMPIESVMPSNYLIICSPLLLLLPIPPSIRVFSNESTLRIRWPKYWSFSFSISPSKEHPGLISFRMDLLDLLAVQGTLKSLLQNHSSKASIFWLVVLLKTELNYRSGWAWEKSVQDWKTEQLGVTHSLICTLEPILGSRAMLTQKIKAY